jgi:polyisoprenoid-binding protein YceI
MYRNSLLKKALAPLLTLLVLVGCTSPGDISPQHKAPSDFPESIYSEYSQAGSGTVYKVDSAASEILVTVRRGGIMASLGHDHIVASHDLQGYIFLDGGSSQNPSCRADFYAPIANLEVDNAELRRAANLATTPSAKDIAGTTSNMFKSVEAAEFPFARLHSSDCLRALSGEHSEIVLSIHGVDRKRNLAIAIEEVSENKIILSGEFSALQSDFGIQPFSIMNGLIKVEDKLELSYRIEARKNPTKE